MILTKEMIKRLRESSETGPSKSDDAEFVLESKERFYVRLGWLACALDVIEGEIKAQISADPDLEFNIRLQTEKEFMSCAAAPWVAYPKNRPGNKSYLVKIRREGRDVIGIGRWHEPSGIGYWHHNSGAPIDKNGSGDEVIAFAEIRGLA